MESGLFKGTDVRLQDEGKIRILTDGSEKDEEKEDGVAIVFICAQPSG